MIARAPLLRSLALSVTLIAISVRGADTPTPVLSYVGTETPTNDADGGLRLVPGVHNLQVYRANRTAPTHGDGLRDTYLHQAMLARWQGKFHLHYLSGPRDEHEAPCQTSYTSSVDGVTWTPPTLLFPSITLPDGRVSVMHQRMGFHVATDGRLLALGFHGFAPSPNEGQGLGRVVREIHADGSFGPIYVLRLNRHAGWSEKDAPYPLYTAAPDAGFIAACDAMIANHLVRNQWWEEDRSTDGFYSITGKAMAYFHRADGKAVGLWKNAQVAISSDEGKTWSKREFAGNQFNNASKYWGQRTSDGRFALFLNPTNRLRHPLAVMTSDDGITFNQLLTVHGELPDQRFPGAYKNMGPQYVRGISEGDDTSPDGFAWISYTVNKEDVWVSRVPGTIRSAAPVGSIHDSFSTTPIGGLPGDWNLYSPIWAPTRIVDTGAPQGPALELRDEDPSDYARAIRIFPAAQHVKIGFKLFAAQTNARAEIDIQGDHGERPVRLAFTENGRIRANHEGIWVDAGTYAAGEWIAFELVINPGDNTDTYDLLRDGKSVLPRRGVFAEPAKAVSRFSLRTGAYRNRGEGGTERPESDVKSPLAIFRLDDLIVETVATPDKP